MKNFTTEKVNQIPEKIDFPFFMNHPNENIEIFSGNFQISDNLVSYKVNGIIGFHWFPSIEVYFNGNIEIAFNDLIPLTYSDMGLQLIFDDFVFGNAVLTYFNTSKEANEISYIEGRLIPPVIYEIQSVPVEKIKFVVPNLRKLAGSHIKAKREISTFCYDGRTILENEKVIIYLDRDPAYSDRKKELEKSGGYIFLYNGCLTSKKHPLSFKASTEIFRCLDTFLSFVNGRRVSSILRTGFVNEKQIWQDYTPYSNDPFKSVISWVPFLAPINLNDMWKKFSELWCQKDNADVFHTLVHWYVESNSNSGDIEGALIFAQTTLELIYNWWIVDENSIIVGKDSENIEAANKIRLLLTYAGVDKIMPEVFVGLKKYAKSENILDGPGAITSIRNAVVHYNQSKRKKLKQIDSKTRVEALHLSIWYFELTMLRILEYQGIYHSRINEMAHAVIDDDFVPWAK